MINKIFIKTFMALGLSVPLAFAQPLSPETGYASVHGLKMYYEIHGTHRKTGGQEGMPLVLIHGGGSTIQSSFGRVLESLAKTHKVIAVELQAHGHTADIDRPLSFEQDADDVADLLKQLHISKADILGLSNGASTTLELAIRHPEVVNKIIVASTMYKKDGAPPEFWNMMKHAKFEQMPQPLKDGFLRANPDTNALYTMFKRDVARMQSFKDIKEEDIKAINAPVFVIISNADVVRPEHAVEMYRLLPHGKLVILPGAHGEYLGEIATPQNPPLITATIAMIEQFLSEPMPAIK